MMSELLGSTVYEAIGALAVEVFPLPAMEGITRVSIEYSGSGDSGDMDQMSFFRSVGSDETVLEENEIAKIEAECPDDLRARLISFVENHVNDYWTYYGRANPVPAITGFFEAFLWRKLNRDFSGWENNDGASGDLSMVFNAHDGTVKIVGEHRSYFVDYETTETEFVLAEGVGEAEGDGDGGL